MKIYEIFSKRQKQMRGEAPDVYQYETIPQELRYQIVYIWQDIFGKRDSSNPDKSKAFYFLCDVLCREYGVPTLGSGNSSYEKICFFLIKTEKTENVIDVIELSFQYIDREVRDNPNRFKFRTISPDEAINELNYRFREHGVGYQYESGQIIKVDSQIIHSEVVKPALSFLSDPIYKNANEEFLKAHELYRERNYKDCVNNCLKAFESCLKIICQKQRWNYGKNDTANRLIAIVFDNGLIPPLMQSHFSGLRSALESGVPTIRNNQTGHGQGPEEITVPEYIASYILHLTASNILLLAKTDEDMDRS